MNEVKKELELLKSWGFETVSIDKVLEMSERTDDVETEPAEKSVVNIFYPPCIKEEGVDKYFREIPMYVNSDKSYPLYNEVYRTSRVGVPESGVVI